MGTLRWTMSADSTCLQEVLAGGLSALQPALSPKPPKGTCLHSSSLSAVVASGIRSGQARVGLGGPGSGETMLARGVCTSGLVQELETPWLKILAVS